MERDLMALQEWPEFVTRLQANGWEEIPLCDACSKPADVRCGECGWLSCAAGALEAGDGCPVCSEPWMPVAGPSDRSVVAAFVAFVLVWGALTWMVLL